MSAWQSIKNVVPWRVRKAARVLTEPRQAPSATRTGLHCPVCGDENARFLPLPAFYDDMLDRHGYIHSTYLTETINRRSYSCSKCGASDRDRLYALYFLEFLRAGGELSNILDIAPQPSLTAFLKRHGAARYRTADLLSSNVDDRIDIQNMAAYEDGRFAIFICSHVLEHVPDDVAAMRELHRVLMPGGWGIAMVPINLGLTAVYENPDIVDEAGRWKHFGQNDHVRLYSKPGFLGRLRSVGFRVAEHGIDHFGADAFARHGIHPRSMLYIAHKPDAN